MHENVKLVALWVSLPLPYAVWIIQSSLAMMEITSSFTTTIHRALKSFPRLLWNSQGLSTLSITAAVFSTKTDWLCQLPPRWDLTHVPVAWSGFSYSLLFTFFRVHFNWIFWCYLCRLWDVETGLCLREIQEPEPTRYHNINHQIGWDQLIWDFFAWLPLDSYCFK